MEIDETIISAANRWGLQIKSIIKNMEIAGSPERSELRFVVQDINEDLFIIESLFDKDIDHKLKIIYTLEFLAGKGMKEIQPYICNSKREYILHHDDRFWQLIPFIDGVSLNRPKYVYDKWRGKVIADFLIQLRTKSVGVPNFSASNFFSIKNYIYKLSNQIKEYEPVLAEEIQPIIEFLEKKFMGIHDNFPKAFCHGDYHSLNIIWSSDNINAVIDWEFLGYKPEIYDVANMIGCVGVEDPESLICDLVKDFIFYLKKAQIISDMSWEFLLEFVIALRFAWLSEWLRHEDREMIELETTYMRLLKNNFGDLQDAWEI